MTDYKLNTEVKIAISGFSGCGNTTVSTLLAEKLNIPCINYTFRTLAEELKIDFKELVEKSKTDFKYDRLVDTKQVELANQGACVLGSRLAIWMLKTADLRVFLTASEDVRAKRIQTREGGSIDEIKAFTEKRDASDTGRYKQLYGIDNKSYGFADLVIDTEKYTPDEICTIILEVLTEKQLITKK